jgi:hypothetical protein
MVEHWRSTPTNRRLLLVDATVLTGPGSVGTDWRVHMLYDPYRAVPCGVEITGAEGGESFGRHNLMKGDLVVGDRGYGHFRGFIAALRTGADVLVRVEPGQMKLTLLSGDKLLLRELAKEVPLVGAVSFGAVWHGPDSDCRKVRIVGVRTAKKDVLWMITNLGREVLSDAEAAEIYRFRWQIELLFKRLKSLMDLGDLRSREGPTARAFIYAKLITAFLALRLTESEAFSPYGYEIATTPADAKSLEGVRFRSQDPNRMPSGRGSVDQGRALAATA